MRSSSSFSAAASSSGYFSRIQDFNFLIRLLFVEYFVKHTRLQ